MSKLCKKINLQPGYVCNPQTGHWVKTGGKIGKQILSKYKKEELIFSGAPPEINVPKKTDLTGMDLLKLLNDPSYSSQIDVDIHQSPTRPLYQILLKAKSGTELWQKLHDHHWPRTISLYTTKE